MSLNLSDLGQELDTIRRARRGEDTSSQPIAIQQVMQPDTESTTSSSPQSSMSSRPSPMAATRALPPDTPVDAPAPLCLLCFARAPSAVLLPCCHLNLCYLCAPLFMHKGATESRRLRAVEQQQTARENALTEEEADEPRTLGRIPFNVALTRAVKGYPQARRLSIGGYMPPPEGFRGGEMRGRDVLAGENAGLKRTREENGRVELAPVERGEAQCLVCRAGVNGWLRVYS